MITPQELKEQEFVKAVFGGYDITSVDEFYEKISDDYAALYKENAVLKSKLKVLVEKVEEYRSTEDSMRMALLTAQKMGNEIVEEANKKSEKIVTEAQELAVRRQKEIDALMKREEEKLKQAQAATSQYSRRIIETYRDQLDFIHSISDFIMPEDLHGAINSALKSNFQAKPQLSAPAKTEKAEDDGLKQSVDTLVEKAMARVSEQSRLAESKSAQKDQKDISGDTSVIKSVPDNTFDDKNDIARSISESLGDTKRLAIDPEEKWDDEDEPTTKRPSFDFDNLKFGSNVEDE